MIHLTPLSPDEFIHLDGQNDTEGYKPYLNPVRPCYRFGSEDPLKSRNINNGDLGEKSRHHAVEEERIAQWTDGENGSKFGTGIPGLKELEKNHRRDGNGSCPPYGSPVFKG